MSETGSDSGGISSHDGSKSDTESNYNMEPSIKLAISHPSTEKNRVVSILYSRDSSYNAYDYYIVAGEICRQNISAMSGTQRY